ncbi:MAG: hypothetical protein RIC52_08930 [Amphiplicatus sp.]
MPQVTGPALISALKKKLRTATDTQLAAQIGLTMGGIQLWKKRKKFTARQVAELVHKASTTAAKNFRVNALRPIAEFFPIDVVESKQRKKVELFGTQTESGKTHKYLEGLRAELKANYGVYVFFDSRGRAIYAGKARRQRLWNEMNAAFNRDRGSLQKIKRVSHPARNQRYKNSEEKARQIVERVVPLHELASYFSAYQVIDDMIDDIETMLVRSFANDLLNKRMERFGQQKKKRTKKKAAKRT